MKRVKKIEELRMSEGFVLLKVIFKNSLIVTPDKADKGGPQLDYAEVVAIGHGITDMKPGDIVLGFSTKDGFEWQGNTYAIVPRMAMKFFVKRENFDFEANGRSKTDLELRN